MCVGGRRMAVEVDHGGWLEENMMCAWMCENQRRWVGVKLEFKREREWVEFYGRISTKI